MSCFSLFGNVAAQTWKTTLAHALAAEQTARAFSGITKSSIRTMASLRSTGCTNAQAAGSNGQRTRPNRGRYRVTRARPVGRGLREPLTRDGVADSADEGFPSGRP